MLAARWSHDRRTYRYATPFAVRVEAVDVPSNPGLYEPQGVNSRRRRGDVRPINVHIRVVSGNLHTDDMITTKELR